MAIWIYRRSSLQSLVIWVNEWCHLQYGLPFASYAVGILWPSGNFSCFSLSNKSKISSALLISKSNPFAGPCCFTHLQDTGSAPSSPFSYNHFLVFCSVSKFVGLDHAYRAFELVLVQLWVALLI